MDSVKWFNEYRQEVDTGKGGTVMHNIMSGNYYQDKEEQTRRRASHRESTMKELVEGRYTDWVARGSSKRTDHHSIIHRNIKMAKFYSDHLSTSRASSATPQPRPASRKSEMPEEEIIKIVGDATWHRAGDDERKRLVAVAEAIKRLGGTATPSYSLTQHIANSRTRSVTPAAAFHIQNDAPAAGRTKDNTRVRPSTAAPTRSSSSMSGHRRGDSALSGGEGHASLGTEAQRLCFHCSWAAPVHA